MKTILITHFALILFVIPHFGRAQLITVSGFVNNGMNGKALENVSIFESNSGIGTISNKNGFYKLTLEKGDLNLSITNNGFKPYAQKLELSSDTTFIVKLIPTLQAKTKQKKDNEVHAGVETEKKAGGSGILKLF